MSSKSMLTDWESVISDVGSAHRIKALHDSMSEVGTLVLQTLVRGGWSVSHFTP